MRKRIIALVLLMVMALGLTALVAADDGAPRTTSLDGKLDGNVLLEISPKLDEVAVGDKGDVWITFSVYLTPSGDAAVPAFSFVLNPDDGMTPSVDPPSSGDHRYSINAIPVDDGTLKYTPDTRYYGIAGITSPLTDKKWVMDMPVKLEANAAPGYYYLDVVTNSSVAKDNFTAGQSGGEQYDRTVIATPVLVTSGVTISGTVIDDAGNPMAGVNVALWQDGAEIATTTSAANGRYDFTGVSTGSYVVKAVPADTTKRGSANVTVAAQNVPLNVTVRAGMLGDVSGDNKINISDATQILRHIKGLASLDGNDCADVNGDGKINISDATAILRHIKGLQLLA